MTQDVSAVIISEGTKCLKLVIQLKSLEKIRRRYYPVWVSVQSFNAEQRKRLKSKATHF